MLSLGYDVRDTVFDVHRYRIAENAAFQCYQITWRYLLLLYVLC